ncbi:hypothetical protein [Candidatus Poriferisocius sp.]|uniref:hypothetical protein n=1 Tax=Candidatus Poriferisocius sp. TaxID=3101276 RepID=UPI003B5234CA
MQMNSIPKWSRKTDDMGTVYRMADYDATKPYAFTIRKAGSGWALQDHIINKTERYGSLADSKAAAADVLSAFHGVYI